MPDIFATHSEKAFDLNRWNAVQSNVQFFIKKWTFNQLVSSMPVGKTSTTTLTKYRDELVQAKILTPKKEGTDIFYLNDDKDRSPFANIGRRHIKFDDMLRNAFFLRASLSLIALSWIRFSPRRRKERKEIQRCV
jgi:hypothetical protein